MTTIIPEANIYPSNELEDLFIALFEEFDKTQNSRVVGITVDALEQAANGNGEWGVFINTSGEVGIWTLAEIEGTFVAYCNGNTESCAFDWAEVDYGVDIDPSDAYGLIYTVLNRYLPEEVMIDRVVVDNVEEEAARLCDVADIDDEDVED